MPITLPDVRTALRKDLHDTDMANYRWADTQLDRHLDHALTELSAAMPLEKTATLPVTPGSRSLSLAALTDLVEVEAVEYPAGQYPPAFTGFSAWETTLTFESDEAPTGGTVNVYYTARHVLDNSGTTMSLFQVETVVAGAAAYASLEQATYTTDRLATGGSAVTERYAAQARARLTAFQQLLYQYGRKNRVRRRRFYVPA